MSEKNFLNNKILKISDEQYDKIYKFIENGNLFWLFEFLIIGIIALSIIISGIEFTEKRTTEIYKNENVKQFHVKKVSVIPREKEKEEAEKISVEDDKISIEDIRKRYYSYIISKIEAAKEYPVSEQKKGHEGSITLKLFLKRNGKIEKVRILRQSRYIKLTKAAITSIKKALPFQAFPKQLPEDEIVLKLNIKFYMN
jgi:TonB family protein